MQRADKACANTHRAWTWQAGNAVGDLVLRRVEMDPLGADEVLVRNAVIGLNPVDWKVLGNSELGWVDGHVPGVDGAGTVIAVGEDVVDTWLGQRVCYHQNLRKSGSFAELTAVDARALIRVPDGVELTVAASFPCPALSAWLAIDKLPTRPGAALLVSGAGGAVGQYAVQLATARGFKVTAMSNPRHWERLKALGASEYVEQSPVSTPTGKDVLREHFFAVVDSVNAEHAMRLAPMLAANGHMVCIQGRLDYWPDAPFSRALSMHEVALGPLHQFGSDADWMRLTDAGAQMLGDIAAGRLKPETVVIDDFDHLTRLLDALKNRDFSGKPLIRIAGN